MQYQASLSTATKLPDVGKWNDIGTHILSGDISKLRMRMKKAP